MKGFAKKLMLISTLLIMTVVLLTYLFILYFESVEENQFRMDTRALFSSSFVNFQNTLNVANDRLNLLTAELNENEEPEENGGASFFIESYSIAIDTVLDIDAGSGFVGVGYVIEQTDNKLANVVFCDKGVEYRIDIVSDLYRGFSDYILFARSTADSEAEYFFYGKRTDKSLTGYDYFLLVSDKSPLGMYQNYNLSNCVILDKNCVVVDQLYPDAGVASFSKSVIDNEIISFNGKNYLVNSLSFEESFTGYALASLLAESEISSQIRKVSIKFYVFMAICSMLMVVFFVLFLVMIRIDKAILGTGEHRIDVDISGNIKGTDKNLEQKYKKLIGNISSFIERSFSENCIVIKAETIEGERAFLNCKRFMKKNSTDYILMASDATDLYNGYLKFRMEHFTDEATEMNNIQQLELDFGDLTNDRSKKPLAFIIYELGIEKYWALYGIEFYKKLLKVLADRLSEIYVWQAKAYYLTGDRFVVMANENVQDIVAKIDSAIEFIISPVRMDDLIIRTVCKAGYLIYSASEEELTLSQIISRIELALSYAKSSNKKNNYGYVDSVMRSKQTLSNDDIKQIIISDEVNVCFQPQYSLKENRIVGFEALTRLTGKYSYINPGAFIENVEQSGAMVMLGDYIVEKSMKFASTLNEKDVKISVNVSPLQLLGENFVERFMLRLQQYELEPSQIGIEITETYEMSSMSKAREKLRELQKQGINIGIDDFGEKYSSLRYIKSLPIDFIKIDKGFVDGVENDRHSRAIIEVIISLGKKLSLYTTVEGVESESQVKILYELGADLIQGYIISPAVSEDRARDLIQNKRNLFKWEGV